MYSGGSAFAGYQAFSPTVAPAQLSGLMQQHSVPMPCEEEEAGEEEVQINNRVAGGAGKRLSVEDLQVLIRLSVSLNVSVVADNVTLAFSMLLKACGLKDNTPLSGR